MPQPTVYDVHYNAPMTDFSVMVVEEPGVGFIADQVFPTVSVQKKSDKYYIYTAADFLRDEVKKRAPGTESQGAGYTLSTGDYACERWALHKDIDDEEVANQDSALDAHQDATSFLTLKMLLRKELDFVSNYMAGSKWGTTMTGEAHGGGGGAAYVDYWSDQTNSTPIEDVFTGILKIQKTTGYRPNTLVLGPETFMALKRHPDILEQYKDTTADSVTTDMIARIMELDRVLVPYAIYDTAAEGATTSTAFVSSKSAFLAYVNPRAGLRQPSAGYTITWAGAPGVGSSGQIMRTIPMPQLQAERMEIEAFWQHKLVSTSLGYYFTGVVA
jgi:hypothetical protein